MAFLLGLCGPAQSVFHQKDFRDVYKRQDISNLDEVQTVKQAYLDMDKELEFIPKDGTYALPYVANAAGILYNKDPVSYTHLMS